MLVSIIHVKISRGPRYNAYALCVISLLIFIANRKLIRIIPSNFSFCAVLICCYAPTLIGGGIKRCFCLTSDVCLSVAYIGPKSRMERPRKTKIGTEIAHDTRD